MEFVQTEHSKNGNTSIPLLSPNEGETLISRLLVWYTIHPDKPLFHFLNDGNEVEGSLSYGELLSKACHIAIHLRPELMTSSLQSTSTSSSTSVNSSNSNSQNKSKSDPQNQHNLKRGDRILLVFLPSLDFIMYLI